MRTSIKHVLKYNLKLISLGMPKMIMCCIGVSMYAVYIYVLGISLGRLSTYTILSVQQGINPLSSIISIFITLVVFTVVAYIGYMVNSFWCFKIRNDIHLKLVESLMSQKESEANKIKKEDDLTTLTSDMATVEGYFFQGILFRLLQPIISGTIALVVIIKMDYYLFLISVVMGATQVLISLSNTKKIRSYVSASKNRSVDQLSMIKQLLEGGVTDRIYHTTQKQRDRYEEYSDAYTKTKINELAFRIRIEKLSRLPSIFAVLLLIYRGLVASYDGNILFTDVIIAINLQNTISNMFAGLSDAWDYMVSVCVSAERICNTLSRDKEFLRNGDNSDDTGLETAHELLFDIHSFSYGEKNIIRNTAFSSVCGDGCTIITGKSGIGKTTIINILLGYYTNYDGIVSIDGLCCGDNNILKWRQYFSYVPHERVLLNRSLSDNISFGNYKDKSELRCRLLDAAKKADVLDFIMSLPNDFDTIVGSENIGLSEGQKQKILIARAFYKDSPVYVFDEPTSALDKSSEENVLRSINAISRNRIVIIVTHDIEHYNNRMDKCKILYLPMQVTS